MCTLGLCGSPWVSSYLRLRLLRRPSGVSQKGRALSFNRDRRKKTGSELADRSNTLDHRAARRAAGVADADWKLRKQVFVKCFRFPSGWPSFCPQLLLQQSSLSVKDGVCVAAAQRCSYAARPERGRCSTVCNQDSGGKITRWINDW